MGIIDYFITTYWRRFTAQKVEVRILSEKVGLWLRGVEALSAHDKVAAKVVSWGNINHQQKLATLVVMAQFMFFPIARPTHHSSGEICRCGWS